MGPSSGIPLETEWWQGCSKPESVTPLPSSSVLFTIAFRDLLGRRASAPDHCLPSAEENLSSAIWAAFLAKSYVALRFPPKKRTLPVPRSGRRQHGMARADRGVMTLRRGG